MEEWRGCLTKVAHFAHEATLISVCAFEQYIACFQVSMGYSNRMQIGYSIRNIQGRKEYTLHLQIFPRGVEKMMLDCLGINNSANLISNIVDIKSF